MTQARAVVEPYTQTVLQKVDPQVLKTLNLVQLEALSKAIGGMDKHRRHALDIRGTLPLFFSRYYFVILAGRDRRQATRLLEQKRRRDAGLLGVLFSVYCIGCGALMLVLLALYFLKASLGIDLVAGQHIWEWLRP